MPDGRRISAKWAEVALGHCERAGVADKVDLRVGDARQLAALVQEEGAAGSFDFVFSSTRTRKATRPTTSTD